MWNVKKNTDRGHLKKKRIKWKTGIPGDGDKCQTLAQSKPFSALL